ncbi:flavin-containing monooxygenase [Nocardia jiangsuensis]|uniref:Flavin-containing monooxygenase n=1 Tax=Nocardia jiangsuensis TaxID=1691563 RepID=A0ABV8DPX2_9NOCA
MAQTPEYEILVIGAGPAGIGTAAMLIRAGLTDFGIVERTGDLGGSWRDNTYPGVGVDIPSVAYQYSFARKADWTHLFARGAEVKAYHDDVAARYNLRERILFHTDIVREVWNDEGHHWELYAADGRVLTARFVLSAVGAFLRPKIGADLEGVDDFAGKIQIPASWDHGYELAGKRVAVIGTGASSVQIVPAVAPEVAQLDVYQRTPAWCLPKADHELPPWFRTALRVPGVSAALHGAGLAAIDLLMAFLTTTSTGRAKSVLARADADAIARYRRYVHRVVDDPRIAEQLIPAYGPIGKRPTASNTFLQAFNRRNVALHTDRIDRVTATGIRTAAGAERDYDMIVLATGYEMFSDPESYHDGAVVGRDGFDLARFFGKEGLQAYESVAIPRLPNRWLIAGPYSWTGSGWHTLVEVSATHAIRAISAGRERGATVVEVRKSAHDAYHEQVRRRGTLINHYFTVQNRGLRTYYVNSQGDMAYLRPSTLVEARWRSRHFPIDHYRFETASGSGPSGLKPKSEYEVGDGLPQ